VLLTTPLGAQQASTTRRIAGPGPSRLRVPVTADTVPHMRPLHETRALRGALIGGIPFALFGVLAGHALCEWTDGEHPDCLPVAILVAPLAAALPAFIGAMIGAATPKPAGEIRPVTGSYWKPVAIGMGGLSAVGGALVRSQACHIDRRDDCLTQALTGGVILGVINGTLGGLLGALIPRYAR
jgi:hypothetical protein